jgi:hypothetical protein
LGRFFYLMLYRYLFILFIACLCSCRTYKPFIPTACEPLLVKDTSEVCASIGIRLFKTIKANVDYNPTKHFVVRGSALAGFKIASSELAGVYMRNSKKGGIFIGPHIGFMDNHSNMSALGVGYRAQSYNACNYNYFGISGGIRSFKLSYMEVQFLFKANYNMVNYYRVAFSSDNGSGKNSGFEINDAEYLDKKIPNFYSLDFGIALCSYVSKRSFMNYQLGFLYCEPVYKHNYIIKYYQSSKPVEKTKIHPLYNPLFINISYVYRFGKKQ